MNKIIKILTLLFCMIYLQNACFASFLRDFEEGVNIYKKGYYKNAQDYFETYILNNPQDEWGYYFLAKAYQKNKKEDENLINENFKKSFDIIVKKRNIEKVFFDLEKIANLEDYFDIAVTYFEAGNYDKSENYADLMLKIDPKSALAYFVKAKTAYTKGDEIKAKEYLEHAIMYNNEIIKTNLATVLNITTVPNLTKDVYYYKAIEKFYEGNLTDTKNNIKNYTALDSTNINMRNFLTDLAFQTQDFDLAQKNIEETLNLNPNNIQNLINQAKMYEIIGREDKIEPVLNKAYKINPNNKELLLSLGNYYLSKKDYKNSKKFFENLILTDDKFYEAYFNHIFCLIEENKLNEAIKQIRKTSLINPNATETLYLLYKICVIEGKYPEARNYIEEAIGKEENPYYYLECAKLNFLEEKYPEAIINLNDTINAPYKIKNEKEIYEYLARCYLETNDIENALKIINSNNKLDKNSIIYKYILYKLNKLQGNDKNKSRYLTKLKKIKPQTQKDYIDLSEFYFEEYGLEASNKILDEGIKKYPDCASLYSQKNKLKHLTQVSTVG